MYSYVRSGKGGKNMKVFISWSGELSKKIAKELSEWLPSIIQSVEVFYSPDDIKKGENWDTRLTDELQDSKYGIVCLTSENVLAPWIHFEAGVISKTLDSKVSALMINVVPSEIQGPLSRFQATRIEKEDFYKLIVSINDSSDSSLNERVLQKSFDAIWDKMHANINKIIAETGKKTESISHKDSDGNKVLEEILQLMRKQDSIISNPEKILPIDYLEYVCRNVSLYQSRTERIIDIIDSISAKLKDMYESDVANKEYIQICYNALIELAEQCGCERGFIRYLQDNYRYMGGMPRRRIKIVTKDSDKLERMNRISQED